MNGREPWLSAAATILSESGCVVRKWRTASTGVADLRSGTWEIECPEPRGAISYATLAHEVAHQLLHRRENGRPRVQRWQEELEAWIWSLDTFERFELPGLDKARADALSCMDYAVGKALRRVKDPLKRQQLAQRIVKTLPEWMLDTVAPVALANALRPERPSERAMREAFSTN